MNKNKKKNPQLIKLEQAHQRNQYFLKLKGMMGIMGSASAFHLLGHHELNMLYMVRVHPVKIIYRNPDCSTQKNKILKSINEKLTELLKDKVIHVGTEKKPVSLYDFFTLTETLFIFWRSIASTDFPNAKKFKEMLPAFNDDFMKTRVEACSMLDAQMEYISWMYSDIFCQLIWFEADLKDNSGKESLEAVFYWNFLIHFERPESVVVEIDGKKRSIYQIGVTMKGNGIEWLTTTPERLGLHGILQQIPLKVYIQAHVLERLNERLGSYLVYFSYSIIISTLMNTECYTSYDGNFLFTCRYMNKKVGYLKATLFEDKFILRTFLFITNNGTPEGKKLADLLGLQKEDKKYLGIDKLSAFLDSDIEQNEKLTALFRQAGCGDLFEIKQYLTHIKFDKTIQTANYLSHYLGLEKKEDV